MEDTGNEKIPSPVGSPGLQNGEQKYEGIDCGVPPGTSTEPMDVPSTPTRNVTPEANLETPSSHKGKASRTKSNKSGRKGKKSSATPGSSSRYPLRSASRSQTDTDQNSTAAAPPVQNTVKDKRKKKRRKIKKDLADRYSSIRNRVRYLIGKMNYEQSLIEAYAGEGWNGQSSEKVRPEKEIERAKSAIMSFKLKIRDQFEQLDSFISEGRHDQELFDTEGQLDSEDIFCAKCGSKELSANNDIILCDGICDRGFHQQCLNPPLSSDDIPSDDEGWLCPGCDCKVDCIDVLNEIHGTDLEIEDPWENVFPEAAAAAARNDMYDDYLGLPSEDSEDEDFAPDDIEQDAEESSSDGSGYISEEPGIPSHVMPDQNLGLPSDDSEDDDFDPNKPDSDEKSFEDGSGSQDSDFTCDSEGSDVHENLISDAEKSMPSPTLGDSQLTLLSGNGNSAKPPKRSSLKAEVLSLMEDAGLDDTMLASGKRERERLDYKRLHDETYGDHSSDSSDDENWTASTAKKIKNGTNIQVSCYTRDKGSSKCKKGASPQKEVSQKLNTSEENQSPRPDKKQILAEELGLSPQQVDRWFSNSGHRVQINASGQSGSRSRKRMPTDTLPEDTVSSKSKISTKYSRRKNKDTQNLPVTTETSVVPAVVKEEPSERHNKSKNKKSIIACEKSIDGMHLKTVAAQSANGGSKMVKKQVPSPTIDRQKLVLKELRRKRRK